jgi:hypothetical protein
MVVCLSNTTTARLAGYARRRGLDIEILISPSNAAGRYFVSVLDGKVLTYWISLGWTRAEAEERIQNMALEEVSDG